MTSLERKMTDVALTESSNSLSAAMLARSRESQQRPVDTVVSLAPRNDDGSSDAGDGRASEAKAAHFSSAIELIHEASEAIRISQERADELELEIKRVIEQASEEMRRLIAEIAAKDALIARSEEQLRASEARGDEAEMWLSRLHDAVFTSFEPLQRARSSAAAS